VTRQTREDVAAGIRADRAFWRSLVAEVGHDRMAEPGPMGEWTFKDLAGHLAGWRNHRISQLEALGRGEPEPPPPWPAELDDDDQINDWIHERDRRRSLDEVLDDYDSSFERLASAVEALPEELDSNPDAVRWSGGSALLEGDHTSHLHDEHVPAVRAWLDRRG
jgi:Mycothiol maleylpyruvate isomerase N-terminal domain